MLNALQPLSDLLFGGMYPSLRQQTAQAHILHFKTEVVFRSHVTCRLPYQGAQPSRSHPEFRQFRFCDKIFDQLYLQLAPGDHLVLLTWMLVAEFLYGLLDAASHGR